MRTKGFIGIIFICMAIALVFSSATAQTQALAPGSSAGIQITNPAGGESLVLGKNYPIRWKAADGVGTLSIALFQNNKFVGFIAKGYPAGKSGYLWPAGRFQKAVARAGGGYTIGIRSMDGKLEAYSPGPFSLTTASSASGTAHSGVVSGPTATVNLPASSSSGSSSVSAPINTHTAPSGSTPQSAVTLQGAPPDKGTFVQRLTDLHFTNPQAGVILEKGRTYTISWDKIGDIDSVKIQLDDLLNQASHWVSQGQDHVINNTGTYRYTVPSSLPDSAFTLQIMTPDGRYNNKSNRFYISRSDTDLFLKGSPVKRVRSGTEIINRYIETEIWLENKGTRNLNTVKVAWQVVKEPIGNCVEQGQEIFTDMLPDTWYKKKLSLKYYHMGFWGGIDHKWGKLQVGQCYVLKFKADPDNTLGEMDLVLDNNTYQIEALTPETYYHP